MPHPVSLVTASARSEPKAVLQRDTVAQAARRAVRRLLQLQRPDGAWEGEMVWCTMIVAQAVIVRTVVGHPYTGTEKAAIIRHFECNQREDGSWGMHPESAGYVFFTALAYVALRLVGVPATAPRLVKARHWLHAQPEGVKAIPGWGKFWLSLLGVYGREGLNPIPPEIFLLPRWLPFHPGRFYCHTRQIYLGIAYLYGARFVAPLAQPLREALRAELYQEPYETIDFASLRHAVAPTDLHVPAGRVIRLAGTLLSVYERCHSRALRRRSLDRCFAHILYEQRNTRYQAISPVNGLLNCLALFAHNPLHPDLAPSIQGLEAWRWEDEAEGIRYVGARSYVWDTAFAMQALLDAPDAAAGSAPALDRARAFLDGAQLAEELPDHRKAWRDTIRGGWCFGQHKWPVSDCAAEALSALLSLYEHPDGKAVERLGDARLREAVEFILSRQNADGGFASYERRRGGRLLETINPTEMYGQCMTELSYIECTGSALAALAHYRRHYPDLADGRIGHAMRHAESFLRRRQLGDGSYPGFWGINYTYAIFHVTKALRMAGAPPSDPTLEAAGRWLIGKQRADGGWGEHHAGCLEGRYVEHPQSQAVMTSWALLALMDILPPEHAAIRRGILWLMDRQLKNGGWPRQAVNGVFFGAAMLDYRLYHEYFPAWALNRYARLSEAHTGSIRCD